MKKQEVLKYRNIWMAFAILWVMVFHIRIHTDMNWITRMQKIGYGGVDIFVFASGIGCYYS